MAFPAILLAIALMAARGPGVWNVIFALSVVYMPRTAILIRSTVLSIRELDYVQAARGLGLAGELRRQLARRDLGDGEMMNDLPHRPVALARPPIGLGLGEALDLTQHLGARGLERVPQRLNRLGK